MTITDALQRTTTQFADTLQQTIQMGVDAQAEENKNARLDKQFNKIKYLMGQTQQSVTPGWKRYMPFVPKWGDHSKKCTFVCRTSGPRLYFRYGSGCHG